MCGRALRELFHVNYSVSTSTLIQGLGVSLFIFSLASHTAGVLTVTTRRNSITISRSLLEALQSSGIAPLWQVGKT